MATNPYFSQAVRSEQALYEDIIIESLKMYGQDVYYLPRDIVNEDRILGDDVPSRFNSSHIVEMYIANTEGFDGEGDLFTKFGVEIRDQATFVVARRRWTQTVRRHDNEINSIRPMEGDLIYLPLSNKIFQIMHVEHERPFYQLSNLVTYELRCELFEYNDEDFDTGVDAIDTIEQDYAYAYDLTIQSSRVTATATAAIDSAGTITDITITNVGSGYSTAPTITISDDPNAVAATLTSAIDSDGTIGDVTITSGGIGYTSAPAITFAAPDNPTFGIGNIVHQNLAGGVIMRGEVADWNDSSYNLRLIHVGADDGKFHSFTTGVILDQTLSTGGVVTAVSETNNIQPNAQNADFSNNSLVDFLDFSESNPFGDPENN